MVETIARGSRRHAGLREASRTMNEGTLDDEELDRISPADRAAIAALVAAGRTAEAVRLAGDAGGLEPAVAAGYVRGLADAVPAAASVQEVMPSGGLDAATVGGIDAALRAGRTIEAIKIYRTATGAHLAVAKSAIDARRAALFGTVEPAAGAFVFAGAGRPRTRSRLGLLAFAVAAVIVAVAAAFVFRTFSAL